MRLFKPHFNDTFLYILIYILSVLNILHQWFVYIILLFLGRPVDPLLQVQFHGQNQTD